MINQYPLVTVIVPVYNTEDYLEKCIKSILNQSYENIQIIIIDDGSTDKSGDICDKFAKENKNISVYHTENRGSVAARKKGLEYALGKYVGFVDSDDYIEESMYETLADNIENTDAEFVHMGFISEKGLQQNLISVPTKILQIKNNAEKIALVKKYMFGENNSFYLTPSMWSKLYKKEFIKYIFDLIPNEQQFGEDILCLFHCMLNCKKISLLSKELYHYVIRDESLSHVDNKTYFYNDISLLHNMLSACDKYVESQAIKEGIFDWIKERLIYAIELNATNNLKIPKYYFANIDKLKGKKIVLYGAGNVGKDYYSQICREQECEIVAWVDINWENIKLDYATIKDVRLINDIAFDSILIAIENENTVFNIKSFLEKKGIQNSKLVWDAPARY